MNTQWMDRLSALALALLMTLGSAGAIDHLAQVQQPGELLVQTQAGARG